MSKEESKDLRGIEFDFGIAVATMSNSTTSASNEPSPNDTFSPLGPSISPGEKMPRIDNAEIRKVGATITQI